MPEISSALTLREILRYCTDRDSPYWGYAWNEFNKRYEKIIYANIKCRCLAWKSVRLKRQLDETVQDIFAKIISELCMHEFKALREFRGHENDEDHERMFLGWLVTVCHHQSNRELKGPWWKVMQDADPQDSAGILRELAPDASWSLYNDVVSLLRDSAENKLRERDIHIFLLGTFAAFSEAMVRIPAYMKDLGERVIQVVMFRMRTKIRKWKKFFR